MNEFYVEIGNSGDALILQDEQKRPFAFRLASTSKSHAKICFLFRTHHWVKKGQKIP